MAVANFVREVGSLQSLAKPLVSCQSRSSPASASLFPLAPSQASLSQAKHTAVRARPTAVSPSTESSAFFGSSFLFPRAASQAAPQKRNHRILAQAAGSSDSDAESSQEPGHSLAPLRPSSPTGEFLVKMLQDYPHLFASAADTQLERLATEKQEADSVASTSGSELVLYE
jgi:hypothetical protein